MGSTKLFAETKVCPSAYTMFTGAGNQNDTIFPFLGLLHELYHLLF